MPSKTAYFKTGHRLLISGVDMEWHQNRGHTSHASYCKTHHFHLPYFSSRKETGSVSIHFKSLTASTNFSLPPTLHLSPQPSPTFFTVVTLIWMSATPGGEEQWVASWIWSLPSIASGSPLSVKGCVGWLFLRSEAGCIISQDGWHATIVKWKVSDEKFLKVSQSGRLDSDPCLSTNQLFDLEEWFNLCGPQSPNLKYLVMPVSQSAGGLPLE